MAKVLETGTATIRASKVTPREAFDTQNGKMYPFAITLSEPFHSDVAATSFTEAVCYGAASTGGAKPKVAVELEANGQAVVDYTIEQWANGPALKVKSARQNGGGSGPGPQATQGQAPTKGDIRLTDERVALDLLALAMQYEPIKVLPAGDGGSPDSQETFDDLLWLRYVGFLERAEGLNE